MKGLSEQVVETTCELVGLPWVSCASTADWDAPLWTNKQHLMSRLSLKGVSVLYMDSPGLRAPSARSGRDLRRIGRRLARWRPWARPVQQRLWRDSALLLPFRRVAIVNALNRRLERFRFGRNTRRLGIGESLLWVYAPTAVALASSRTVKGVVYHCVDDLLSFPGVPSSVAGAEAELVRRADVCIGSSRPLVRRLEAMGAKEVMYWPNCADTAAFGRVASRTPPASGRPVAGFVGAVQEHKVDMELICDIARLLPGWDLRLVGPLGEGLGSSSISASQLPANVQLVGSRPREDLPDEVAQFDVAMIPYRVNDYTRHVFPMKVFEYLAAGVPVVSTELPSLIGEVEHVAFASTLEEWVSALERGRIEARNPSTREILTAYASEHSWENRTDEALKLLKRWAPSSPCEEQPV